MATEGFHLLWHLASLALGAFFIRIGFLHFTDPSWFEPIVPNMPGTPRFWVLLSGAVEVVLGTGLIIPFLRKWSAKATAIFLVLIYPANLNMWINDLSLGDGTSLSPSGHVIRMLAQMTAIAGCLWISRKNKTLENKAS